MWTLRLTISRMYPAFLNLQLLPQPDPCGARASALGPRKASSRSNLSTANSRKYFKR